MSSFIEQYRARSPLAREAVLAGVAIFIGVSVLPLAVYFTGMKVLGPYAGGGLFRFWGDFFVGLAHGGVPWWLLALGPYALVLAGRGFRLAWRRSAGM